MLLLSLSLALLCAGAHAVDVDVDTEYGRVHGVKETNPTGTAFYGIPYAAPPVNTLRFKSPIPPTPWSETRDCTRSNYTSICPQFPVGAKFFAGSEDCLYLDIYVPSTPPPPGGFPVMFWIYGGGYTIGDGYEFGFYRGKYLAAKRNVIVVEHNYRLGALGLLALPELQAESAYKSTGNYALQDQQAALAFTYRNIEKFSGNPKQITIFGQSAGAFSVCWHLVSPLSRPYFVNAIMESGSCGSPEFFISQPRSFLFSSEFSAMLGCDGSGPDSVAECMRGKSIDALLNSSAWPDPKTHVIPPLAPSMPWGVTIDGSPHGLLARPLDLIIQGQWAKVPLLLGSNLNEGSLLILSLAKVVPGAKRPLDATGFNLTVRHFFNDTASDDIIPFYLGQQFKSFEARAAFMLRDFFFSCQARRIARAVSDQGVPAFLYQFVQRLENWIDYKLFGDYHSVELAFVFDHQWPPGLHTFSPDEQALSDSITRYWSNVAKYGTPNGDLQGELYWPPFNRTGDANMYLEHPTHAGQGLLRNVCDFWENHYEKFYFE